MMPCDYISLSGESIEFDLDAVVDVCASYSGVQRGWTATLIYVLATKTFVELRSSPQDIRGNSHEESVEVSFDYIEKTFAISTEQLQAIQCYPSKWLFINMRGNSSPTPQDLDALKQVAAELQRPNK